MINVPDRRKIVEQSHRFDAEVSPGFRGRDIPVIVRYLDRIVDDGTGRGEAHSVGCSRIGGRKVVTDGVISRLEVCTLKLNDVMKTRSVGCCQSKARIGTTYITYQQTAFNHSLSSINGNADMLSHAQACRIYP